MATAKKKTTTDKHTQETALATNSASRYSLMKSPILVNAGLKEDIEIDTTTASALSKASLEGGAVATYNDAISLIPADCKDMTPEQSRADITLSDKLTMQLEAATAREGVKQAAIGYQISSVKTARMEQKLVGEKAKLAKQIIETAYCIEDAKLHSVQRQSQLESKNAKVGYYEGKANADVTHYNALNKGVEIRKVAAEQRLVLNKQRLAAIKKEAEG